MPAAATAAEGQRRLKDRVALITGASRGIGAAVARRFAREGAHVILVARTVGGLEEVDDAVCEVGGSSTLVPLDLGDLPKIDELGGALAKRFRRLDILVGNAGQLGTLSPAGHIDPPVWDSVMRVNVTANWRLIRSVDPLLRASDAGRAIFVTSAVARTTPAYWGAYAASKAALEALVHVYAAEVARTRLRVNLVEPRNVRTRMRAQAMPGEDPASLPSPDAITDTFVELAEPGCERHGEIVRAVVRPAAYSPAGF
jgi:NAD(P)-dependent dehydrogenase (short-subunit alcohol dehydrogenase family)